MCGSHSMGPRTWRPSAQATDFGAEIQGTSVIAIYGTLSKAVLEKLHNETKFVSEKQDLLEQQDQHDVKPMESNKQ